MTSSGAGGDEDKKRKRKGLQKKTATRKMNGRWTQSEIRTRQKKGTNMNGEGKLGSKVITWVVSGSPELSNQLQKAVKCGGGVGRI